MRKHFSGFDGVRAIAAFAVMISHIENYKLYNQLPSLSNSPIMQNFAHQGVNIFFVLSGFLITYLLLVEEKVFGKIDTRQFYKRRALRIAPLYVLTILIAFSFIPNLIESAGGQVGNYIGNLNLSRYDNLYQKLILFIFFLPNLSLVLHGSVSFSDQTWSLGVEEQFYLIWPHVLKIFRKHKWVAMLTVILVKIFLVWCLGFIHIVYSIKYLEFLNQLRFEHMAVGGIAAWLYFTHPEQINKFFVNPISQILATPTLIFVLCSGDLLPLNSLLSPILISVSLLCLQKNSYNFFNLQMSWLTRLGKISYGIYMFHPLMIVLSLLLIENTVGLGNSILVNASVYVLVPIFTIGTAELSYRYFERPFLQLKKSSS